MTKIYPSRFRRFCSRYGFQLLAGPGELAADDACCLSSPRGFPLAPSLERRAPTLTPLSSSPDALRPRQSPWRGRFLEDAVLHHLDNDRVCISRRIG